MWNRIYWLVTGLVLAIAIHAGYLLVAPGLALDRNMRNAGVDSGATRFEVLQPKAQSLLFPTYPASSLFGLCSFDVSQGPVALTAAVPDGFWTLTIYSRRGDVIYALNSRQSGTNSFTVTLKQAPGLIESLTRTAGDDPDSFTGWNVATPDARGVAVLWMPLSDAAERKAATAVLGQSSCSRSQG
jgi:uncharacterized membrane protein